MPELRSANRIFCVPPFGQCHRTLGLLIAWGILSWASGTGAAAPAENLAASSIDANAPPVVAPIALGDDELIIREVFQSHLPETLKKYSFRLWLNPHLGDFYKRDYLRISTGIRYGLTKNCEVAAGSDLYFSHGFGHVRSFDRYGAANLELSIKINLGQPVFSGWDTAAGFDTVFPTGRPPAELTDGLRHYRPYVTFSHRLEAHRGLRGLQGLRIFWGLRLDEITHTSVPGEFGRNDLKDNSAGITGGFVIDRNNWHYTFEGSYDTTRFVGHNDQHVFMVRPGVLWEILSRSHPRARSNWVIGAAVSSTTGPGGTSLGGSLKLRYNLDLKSWWHHTPPDAKS